jgi:uncharacterized repeat protein (TIGR03803 family)
VFELSPGANGWTQTVLHDFDKGIDGSGPTGALIFDAEGNLYGTTRASATGAGTIFELSPTSGALWTFKLLHKFTGGKDGGAPTSALISDSAGNFYGTAAGGGDVNCTASPDFIGCGVVFKLERTAKGGWAEIVLHTFTQADGAIPIDGLTWGPEGNLYGTTAFGKDSACGGGGGCGVVFRLVPQAAGVWKYTPVHIFTGGDDGGGPSGTLVFDGSGSLYGATYAGGAVGFGTVFRLTQTAKGGFMETVLTSFGGGILGPSPTGVTIGPSGVLYGTTSSNAPYGDGVLFSITPTAGGWTCAVLHTFTGGDGSSPAGLLVSGGNIYGVAQYGGASNLGVAFEFVP